MALVPIRKPEGLDDPIIKEIFSWLTDMEAEMPNNFYTEMNFPQLLKAKLATTNVLWQLGELSMPEIQHVDIAVSKENGSPRCTTAFRTILNFGLQTDEEYTKQYLEEGTAALSDPRLKTLVEFALKPNLRPKDVTDEDVAQLREAGLTDKGVMQLIHLVSDFASYNPLNLALDTDYDYQDLRRQAGFGWQQQPGESAGDNTRGVRR